MRLRALVAPTAALLVVLALQGCGGGPEDAKKEAQKAAESWLPIVDSGKYDDSWTLTAAQFRRRVTQEKWKYTMCYSREPLGKVSSRTWKSASYSATLTREPDGQYVVIEYATSFAHKPSAVETITQTREADGTWKVCGYYIK